MRSNEAYRTMNAVAFGYRTCPCVSLSEARAPPGMARRIPTSPHISTNTQHNYEGNDMQIYRLAAGMTVVGLMLTVTTGWAGDSPREKKIQTSFACSAVPSTFDYNGDGITATLNECKGKGSGGPFTTQGLGEHRAPLAAPVTCPPGTTEYPYEATFAVVTNSNTFDQLITGNEESGVFCLNPNGTFTFDVTDYIFRGTGKLTGAQGLIESKGTGSIVTCDQAGRCISNYAGTSEGTLILP